MAKCKTLVFLVLIHCSSVMGQDYVAYQQTVNRGDRMILAGNLEGALGTLDSVGAQYRFIYARHCLKALQVACVLNDSVRAGYWLGRAFLQGVPLQ